jgi:heme exporter protein B
MMAILEAAKAFWWLIRKDLVQELRAKHVWPGMLLLGFVLVLLLATQIDLPMDQRARVGGGMLWLATYFAGTLALERSFTNERDAGCWPALMLYSIAPSVLFLAKMAVNLASLLILEIVLAPVFIVLTDVPLFARPGPMILIAAVSSVGYAAIGTLVSGLTAGLRHRGGLLALLLLPLVTPVILGSAEATRMVLSAEIDPLWWQWIQLLAVFAFVFTIVGALAFEFVMEE